MYLLGGVVGHRLADRTFENFEWSEDNVLAKQILYSFLHSTNWTKGVGIVGKVGVGKTHLLIALYKNRLWRSVYQGTPVPVWLSFQELVGEVKQNSRFIKELVDEYGMVFLDDVWSIGMGVEERGILRELVLYCYDLNKTFCYTSNFSVQGWDVDERVKDRIREMCVEVELKGDSLRGVVGALR